MRYVFSIKLRDGNIHKMLWQRGVKHFDEIKLKKLRVETKINSHGRDSRRDYCTKAKGRNAW